MPNPPPSISAFIAASGGVSIINYLSYDTNAVLTRNNTTSGTQTVLLSGINNSTLYVDMGDGFSTNVSYLPSGVYSYTIQDAYGASTSSQLNPSYTSLAVFPEYIDLVFIKSMKAALDYLSIPDSFSKARVYHAMPLGGYPPLPAVVIQQELFKQMEIPIGQDVQKEENDMTMYSFANWRYSVAILSKNSEERDFYRSAIIGCFNVIVKDILANIGRNMRHSFTVESDMTSTDDPNTAPGFYYADCLLSFDGSFYIGINQEFPTILTTSIAISGSMGDINNSVPIN